MTRAKQLRLAQGFLLGCGNNIYGYTYIRRSPIALPAYVINEKEAATDLVLDLALLPTGRWRAGQPPPLRDDILFKDLAAIARVCSWHRAEVFGAAAMPSGYRVTFPVPSSQ